MSWARVNLGDIAEFKNGLNFNKDQYGQGVKYISVADFQDYFSVKTENLAELKEDFINASYFLKEGDILFVRSNGNKELVGRNLFIENTLEPLTFSGFCIRARFIKEDVLPKFYAYLFKSKFFRNTLSANAGGTNINNLNQGILSNLNIPKPPLPTQRKIACILSAYDDLIENNLKRIKLLEEKAFLRYKWIVNSEKLGLKAFSEVADYVNGYPFKPDDWKVEGLPIIKIKELKAGVQNDTPRNDGENIPDKYFIENKDILFAWSASIGAYLWCSGKSILNQHIFNVKPFDKDLHNWLYFSLLEKIPDFINLSNGATMQHIKKSALGMVYLPVPPKRVYEEFQKETEPILNLIVNLNQQNTKLREARDILLPRLMSGEIEV
jgi:type I restriction enzyme, S subunit